MNYQIRLADGESGNWETFNRNGEQIESMELTSGFNQISLNSSRYAAGLYFYRTVVKNRQVDSGKFMFIE